MTGARPLTGASKEMQSCPGQPGPVRAEGRAGAEPCHGAWRVKGFQER